MALLPFTLLEPTSATSPLVVDSPHSGRIYPVDFEYTCPLPLLRQAEDAFVDELVSGAAAAGASVLAAEFPRSMIDANRAEDDIDPAFMDGEWDGVLTPDAMTLAGFGLVRRLCRNGIDLYRAPLKSGEVRRRIETYYRPYHAKLRELIEIRLQHFGVAYLIDAHSMPDRVHNGVTRPDFILGDRNGTSCDHHFTRRAQRILQDMGYRVTLNEPYKGREIVERFGKRGPQGARGAQALQIEINRKLYMDETTVEKTSGFKGLQEDMASFFSILTKAITTEMNEPLAAE